MDYTFLIYDAAVVILAVVFMIIGAKDGFAKTFVQTAGAVFSVIAATVISRICASLLYTTVVQPAIVKALENSLNNALDTETVTESLEKAITSLPAISHLIFDFDSTAVKLSESVGISNAKIAAQVEEGVISPVLMPLLEILIFILALLLLLCVVRLLAKGSKSVNYVPVVGNVNSFFGGVLGAVNGIVIAIIAAAAVRIIIISRGEGTFFSEKIISETYLFKWIYSLVCGDTFSV